VQRDGRLVADVEHPVDVGRGEIERLAGSELPHERGASVSWSCIQQISHATSCSSRHSCR
jgi:hypothetical protein